MTTLVGTSGFSFKDWVGPVYPEDLPKKDWLHFYAQEFPTCELNFSYYRIPNAWTMERIADKVPEGFLFSIKAFRGITHDREEPEPEMEQFVAALDPLLEQGKFATILAQFPHSFHNTKENREYLHRVRMGFGELPVVVEFRGRDWITEDTFDQLQEMDFGFCNVDQPQFKSLIPPMSMVTGPVGYVRFHGRNYEKWWQHDEAWERYNYAYSDEELMEWVPRIRQMDSEAPLTLVYMNNHWQGQSVDTARQLRMLLKGN
ncbi:MAG: DUF72 domain-containing protein [Anaerolineae bacterium]|jgi:uncharacterized protein YecE (DUF72 family)